MTLLPTNPMQAIQTSLLPETICEPLIFSFVNLKVVEYVKLGKLIHSIVSLF